MKDWTGNNKAAFSTIGASNHSSKEREVDDYYATDPIAIDALERAMYDRIPLGVWECACGGGHLSERLRQMGFNVVSSDKVNRGYGDVVDFLTAKSMPIGCECIITNPPYRYALEFVRHALELLNDGERCFFFLKTTFLEGQRRYDELFKTTPPEYVLQFSKRVLCAKNGDFENSRKEGSAVAYAWYVWRKGFKGDTIVRWI